jgi:hypothetical protein
MNTGRSSQEVPDVLAGCAVVAFGSNATTTPKADKKPNGNFFIKIASAADVGVDTNPSMFLDPESSSVFVKPKKF